MRQGIVHTVKNFFAHKAIVLMYHRVAAPESDVWDITVSPDRFEEHLQVLKKQNSVISLQQLVTGIKSKTLPKNSIAITFDDGYIDNFKIAKPLLEKYDMPATFFITSVNIGHEKEFWWDELEQLILFSEKLPAFISLTVNETIIEVDLKAEILLNEDTRQKHSNWKAGIQSFPTARARLFYDTWQQLRPLPHSEQQAALQKIRQWAQEPATVRSGYRTMSVSELKQLASNDLFTIGSHTVTHPALAFCPVTVQRKEILENKAGLQKITGRQIRLFSYPFGNYNEDTIKIAREADFDAAFTTEENTITTKSPEYRLGRFQAKNLTGVAFQEQIKQWRSHK